LAKRNTSQVVVTHITIGLQLAITILLFVFAGYYLDQRYSKSPIFTALGAFAGMIFGFYSFMKEIQQEEKKQKAERKDEQNGNRKRIKWM